MASGNEDNVSYITYLVIKYLKENNCTETVNSLGEECGRFFNLHHFEQMLIAGNWDELEAYLSSFTKFDNNPFSAEIFFCIKRQKYLEALDKRDHAKAAEILWRELKMFENQNTLRYKKLIWILPSDNFRETEGLSNWKDAQSSRVALATELKGMIISNPDLKGKLELPFLEDDIESLLDDSLEYQHYSSCENPEQAPDLHPRTLFEDKTCDEQPRAFVSQALPSSRSQARASSGKPPLQSTSARRGRRG